MKKNLLLTILLAMITTLGFSQSDKFWSANRNASTVTKNKAVTRTSFPKEYALFDLNFNSLSQKLYSITKGNSASRSTIISLPNADGEIEEFEVYEASNFEPALQSKFPLIRAFSGKGITDRSATLKLSIAPSGIQTMIFRTDKANEFLEPFSVDAGTYAAYRSSRNKGSLPWTCSTKDQEMFNSISGQVNRPTSTSASDGVLRTMRLAQSCNGEYANYFGASTAGTAADVAIVLAAYNGTLTRCNGVYEKDLALHLNLVAESVNVIYFNPATDPYTTLANWNTQLQIALNTTLTGVGTPIATNNAAYDIGHMFGASGGGGNAGCIGCVCVDGVASGNGATKGRGITSPADGIPLGDNFDIDYVAHEIGHQLGGNHTFSFNNEGSGVNKEVGSGITIMGYAGITPQDVANHSIDIFHETSINQIQTNLAVRPCIVVTPITANNATPVITPVLPRVIPISTPFYLEAVATDANAGDVLTYCWEQDDNGTGFTGANSVAFPGKTGGPNWLSFPAVTTGTRLFPRLSTILAGNLVTGPLPGGDAGANIEALSSVGRVLNFRLTVRDNSPYVSGGAGIKVGQTAFTDVAITVTTTSGPFAVTIPNTNVSWPGGSTQTITWDVNNTTAAPVSCANVRISLSTNGGLTFPTVLAASTPNDGTEALTIPIGASTTARIKVEAVGNIFFDISNTNFTVAAPLSDFTLSATAPTAITCGTSTTSTSTVTSAITGTFNSAVNLSASGVPAGTTVTFGTNPIAAPGNGTSVVTLSNANTLPFGTYNVTITGTAGAITKTVVIPFVVAQGAPFTFTTNPSNQVTCAGTNATFTSLAPGVVTYQWQVSTVAVPAFTNISGATAASYTVVAPTVAMSGNQYRVIATSQCSVGTSAAATLTVNAAPSISSNPSNQTVCAGTTATFNVTAAGAGLMYQWQVSTTGCAGTFVDIAGAMGASYTTPAVTALNNGYGYRVVVSGTCTPSVTSTCATLTVGDAAMITIQPQPTTVCAPANASFSVTATGSSLTYQWQVSTAAVPAFTNILGATASTYTTGTTPSMNGNQYRVIVFSCTPTGITSSAATLTVNTPIAISVEPQSQTVCQGTSTTFSVTAAGTGIGYQWQYSSTGCGGTFANITGATSASYNIASPSPANNGGYRVIVSGTCGNITSACATLLVNTPIVITSQPVSQALCVPTSNSATFTVAATGTLPTYQWQVSIAGGAFANITGATSSSYTVTPLATSQTGNQYRVIVSGTCTPAGVTSNAATLTVNSVPIIVTQPTNKAVCEGSSTSFTVAATGSTITYQWQVSLNGGPFNNLANAAPYSGVTTATLTVNPATLSLNGNVYRVIVSGVPCGAVNSNPVTLTVNPQPSVVLTAASITNSTPAFTALNAPGAQVVLSTTISPAGLYSFVWFKNGSVIPAVTTAGYPLDANEFGTYYTLATNTATGCTQRSNDVTVTPASTSTVFVYPNPNNGNFQVRYFNSTNAAVERTIRVMDSKGANVYSRKYTIAPGPYAQMDVQLSKPIAKGIYIVEIRDAGGKLVGTSRILVDY